MQLQARLALQRRSLTLWQSPAATLRHFAVNASNTVFRGLLWTLQHPLTLFIALPLVGLYLGLKYTGKPGSLGVRKLCAVRVVDGKGLAYASLMASGKCASEYVFPWWICVQYTAFVLDCYPHW